MQDTSDTYEELHRPPSHWCECPASQRDVQWTSRPTTASRTAGPLSTSGSRLDGHPPGRGSPSMPSTRANSRTERWMHRRYRAGAGASDSYPGFSSGSSSSSEINGVVRPMSPGATLPNLVEQSRFQYTRIRGQGPLYRYLVSTTPGDCRFGHTTRQSRHTLCGTLRPTPWEQVARQRGRRAGCDQDPAVDTRDSDSRWAVVRGTSRLVARAPLNPRHIFRNKNYSGDCGVDGDGSARRHCRLSRAGLSATLTVVTIETIYTPIALSSCDRVCVELQWLL